MEQSTRPFLEQLLLNVSGPLITALLGTLVFGFLLQRYQGRREDQQIAEETRRADQQKEEEARQAIHQREEDQRREDHQLRAGLVADMTQAASTLYLETQRYWRAKREVGPDELEPFRKDLDARYHQSRIDGEVIESRLAAHFIDKLPRLEWHAVMDLLTVRYFYLIDLMTDRLVEDNSRKVVGDETRLSLLDAQGQQVENHSGLEPAQLKNPKTLLTQYHAKLHLATQRVLMDALRRTPSVPPDGPTSTGPAPTQS